MFKDFVIDYYLYIKAFHIISIISWMAGLLYLPRIFVYHTRVKAHSDADELFKTMERKLLRIIMLPSLITSSTSGMLLIYAIGFEGNVWMHVKLLLVVFLLYSHHLMAKYATAFAQNKNMKSERYFRIFNEVPTVLMILIVTLVVVKFL
ncbi:protoporphyrinogen oxidase HemJ [Candidatus Bandiella euplotis]|uniref:Protoporphyrinogen IX oxidase n=1 Tax=Candidatus Bandiella euplotis TaxID=1664265 RepID=A0ABZ0UN69_9RICK|nr:protoporphyrinogen oxidase HemJ [Candidatus Bandiella woodruffii]WPX96270.1 CopD family protein [Candidatus Bandiella woodruffii]